ncbi:hypothetical protein ANCCAN_08653 [Ancylostoma caninum]|uniref:Uncharacterized protein n=1 Tax=Ancylostoma caninum TaxID=29170 RepID=A0A368GLU5_ANCCA|nr:hypothetical protein ANCCAN_08653 [Ancylostoma caninum]
MGFYDEDDIFSNVPEYDRSPQQPEPKRLRLNEPSTSWASEFPRSAFDETLDKPDAVDADEDFEQDPEEVEVRLATLRRIGLRADPRRALRRYLLNKVVTGKELNPWVSAVYSEKNLRKKLRRYVLGLMVRACAEEGVEDCQLEQSHTDAFKFIDRLNEQLIQSLAAVGTFSSEQLRCARSNCQKAFLPRKLASTLVMRVNGDYTRCQVPECPRCIDDNDDVNYLIVEGGIYGHRLEMPDYQQSPSKLLCFCAFHNGLFEFLFDFVHMKWNIYHNCLTHIRSVLERRKFKDSDDVIDELPSDVLRSIVHHYLARYYCFWVFGDLEMWTKNGCTLFQAISGN